MKWLLSAGLVVVVLVSGAFVAQRFDLAATLDGANTISFSDSRANSATTGTAVNLAGYNCAMLQIVSGVVDIVGPTYVVLQDSTPGSATWVAQDSIAVDSTDNKYYDLNYKGNRQWVRGLQRASGNAADTVASAGYIVRGCKRAR